MGCVRRAGVEGTGTYGAGLARLLRDQGIKIFEINRPNRAKRRFQGKSDPTDAENAARSVLSGEATAVPKFRCGAAEAIRLISVAKRSAVKAKTQAINQLGVILISVPQDSRERLWKAKPEQCAAGCAHLRQLGSTTILQVLTSTLRLLTKRCQMLVAELKELGAKLEQLTTRSPPTRRAQFGVGEQAAATSIAVAEDNPERLRSEGALAPLCGVSPLQAFFEKNDTASIKPGW